MAFEAQNVGELEAIVQFLPPPPVSKVKATFRVLGAVEMP